jgi:uncharacterized protein
VLLRRLAVLLVIGLIHLVLIWNGDILTEYAVAGLVALPFLFGPRWLLAVGALMFLTLYLMLPHLLPAGMFPGADLLTAHVAAANRIYGAGGFLDVLAFRIQELPLIVPLHSYVFPRTIGLFLFGSFVWRIGILHKPSAHSPLLLGSAAGAICLGAVLTFATANGIFGSGWFNFHAGQLTPVVLAIGYAAAVIGLTNFAGGRSLLGWAAPLGRMAFTNYLAQSIIFGWIFYGYGLGLFGRLGAASALGIGIAVYIGQVLFSAWWLGRYRYGPVEWLWRTLMYGVSQPMSVSAREQAG